MYNIVLDLSISYVFAGQDLSALLELATHQASTLRKQYNCSIVVAVVHGGLEDFEDSELSTVPGNFTILLSLRPLFGYLSATFRPLFGHFLATFRFLVNSWSRLLLLVSFPGIDVVIAGHTHEQYFHKSSEGGLYSQCGARGEFLTSIHVGRDDDRMVQFRPIDDKYVLENYVDNFLLLIPNKFS